MPQVTLSDGQPCGVRQLGIYELDALPRPRLGMFTYTIELKGGPQEAEFDISAYDEPPSPPEIPEHAVKERSEPWYQWQEYHMYQAALLHRKRQLQAAGDHAAAVKDYILAECIAPEDRRRVMNAADWRAIRAAALTEELTMELLAAALHNHLEAEYDGEDIFTALKDVAGGKGRYDAIKLWEGKVMLALGRTEAEYARLSLDERSRHVVRLMADEWLGQLEMSRMKKERELEEAGRRGKSKAD